MKTARLADPLSDRLIAEVVLLEDPPPETLWWVWVTEAPDLSLVCEYDVLVDLSESMVDAADAMTLYVTEFVRDHAWPDPVPRYVPAGGTHG